MPFGVEPTTSLAVALTCCIRHSAKDRNRADLTSQGAKTLESILMKLGMVDYVRESSS